MFWQHLLVTVIRQPSVSVLPSVPIAPVKKSWYDSFKHPLKD